MHRAQNHILALRVCGFVILTDQLLKYLSVHILHTPTYGKYIAWEPFLNPGIAFGIPLPWWVQLVVTPFLLWGIYRWATRNQRAGLSPLAFGLVLGGACSNAIDRILFRVTLDYLRIGTAVINLADVAVVCGILLLLIASRHSANSDL